MLDHPTELYRLPWSLTDNVLSWLEPTKRCNLACDGCYSRNDPSSDKSFEQIRADLDAFVRQRKVDAISIAGGDPLLHPDIVRIVRTIRETYGLKPVINTNGLALEPDLLKQLVDAGLVGITFHVDSKQGRPGWKKASERDLDALRLSLAQQVKAVGDVSVAFNCTVYPDTLADVPGSLKWAAEHIDLVHTMVFILYRTMRSAEFSYYANGREVAPEVVYDDQEKNPTPLTAHDLLAVLRKEEPEFAPAAYLGGTRDPNAFKWLLTGRVGANGRIAGYVGPRTMEMVQNGHHWLKGRWLAYTRPELLAHGRSMAFGMAPFDPKMRRVARSLVRDALRAPARAAERLHYQSVLIIQPIDMMPDGEQSMCDGCPDMTVLDGQLVWSCRLDERTAHGCFLTSAPRALA